MSWVLENYFLVHVGSLLTHFFREIHEKRFKDPLRCIGANTFIEVLRFFTRFIRTFIQFHLERREVNHAELIARSLEVEQKKKQ